MENATKALIMAGAILIAILIISVGIMVFNSTKGVTEEGKKGGEIMATEAYNNQFTKFCGERVKGSTVKDLINYVNTYKARNNGEGPSLSGITTDIMPSEEYKVSVPNDGRDTDGKVTIISISQ